MTTNKPEVVAWYLPSSKTTVPVVSLSARNGNGQPLIRLSDYEALQAECEKLRKDASQYRRLIELGEDFQWENIIRVDISDFPSRTAAIDAAMQRAKP